MALDLGKLMRAGDFPFALSSGTTVHVRTLTSSDLDALQTLARTAISDTEFARDALRLAARRNPRPEKQAWNVEEALGDCNDIAATATPEDLVAFSEKLIEKNPFVPRGTKGDEPVPPRTSGESPIAFLRRALIFRHDASRRTLDRFLKHSREVADQGLQRLVSDSLAIRQQMDVSRSLMQAASALPRAEERFEAMVQGFNEQFAALQRHASGIAETGIRIYTELTLSSQAAERSTRKTVIVAVGSIIIGALIALAALMRDLYDYKLRESKPDPGLETIAQDVKALKVELSAMRNEANARALPTAPAAGDPKGKTKP